MTTGEEVRRKMGENLPTTYNTKLRHIIIAMVIGMELDHMG